MKKVLEKDKVEKVQKALEYLGLVAVLGVLILGAAIVFVLLISVTHSWVWSMLGIVAILLLAGAINGLEGLTKQ